MSEAEMQQFAASHNMTLPTFTKNYLVARQGRTGVCIFQVSYSYTNHARPPDDGKLRDLNPDVNWLTIGQEHILPKPGVHKYPPLPIAFIYS
ncbi:MAG: hypothetical protein HZB24_12350 [Desulfobacterales bacterium]|nr:hypothetical protein [Desulfobacterales bacterium]